MRQSASVVAIVTSALCLATRVGAAEEAPPPPQATLVLRAGLGADAVTTSDGGHGLPTVRLGVSGRYVGITGGAGVGKNCDGLNTLVHAGAQAFLGSGSLRPYAFGRFVHAEKFGGECHNNSTATVFAAGAGAEIGPAVESGFIFSIELGAGLAHYTSESVDSMGGAFVLGVGFSYRLGLGG